MAVRCSLDDFLRYNKYQVRVSPYSLTVHFPGVGYHVPAGRIFDLQALEGKSFQLETDSVRAGTDISTGVGFAFILDRAGKKTGYLLGAYGGQNSDGTKQYHGYYIEDERGRFGNKQERMKRMLDKRRRELASCLPLPYLGE